MRSDNNNQMDPQELKNLFVFFVLAILIYFSYDHFVLKPQKDALREAQKVEAQIAQEKALKQAQSGEAADVVLPRAEVLSGAQRLSIDTGEIKGTINLTGGRFDDIALREYYETIEKEDNVTILSPNKTEKPRYIDYGWVVKEGSARVPDADTRWQVLGANTLTKDTPVTLMWDNGAGLRFERIIALDQHYMFTITQKVTNNSGQAVTLYPYGLISQQGIPKNYMKTWIQHEGPMAYVGDSLHEIRYKELREDRKEAFDGDQGWIGMTEKYWLTALVPAQGENVKYSFSYKGAQNDKDNTGRYQVDYVGGAVSVAPGQSQSVESHVYAGAKKYLLLNDYEKDLGIPHFDLAINFGWLWFLSKPFFYALHYLGKLIGNMGFAIIVLTILIRGAVFPLTNTSYRSFAKMKKVTPQVAALREKHGDDKQKLQQELMQLYQREGVNPMAGCFPIMLQIPIFFALYKVLFVTIEIRHAPFIGWIHDLSAPDPTSVFNLFGLIDWTPPAALHIGVWPCVMLIAMIMQKSLNPPPQDKLQRDMMRFFPFIITYALSRFASGLVIYWTFSAIIGVIQQVIIMRSLNVPIHLFGQSEEEERLNKAIDKGPDVHPLAEMAEHEAEDALFGDDDKPSGPIKPPKRKKSKKKK
ncbi:MAG: membrane protein insertase YidC [Alphaproteobacteria bacterium]|nr:membrane protein insertase YidC [Alphaproteobacteria bacterium]